MVLILNIINITNDDVTLYIHDYYKSKSDELKKFRKIGEDGNVPIIQKETEMCLNTILDLKKPKKILEIGTAIGYSSAYFATICKDSVIYSIEKDEYAYKAAKENISRLGLNNRVHLYLGDGQQIIEKLYDDGINEFDCVFIDAAKSHYKRFMESALTVCAEDAIIISDNIFQRAMTVNSKYDIHDKHRTNIRKMRDYVDFICRDSRFETSIMAIGDGLALTIYKRRI